MRKEAILLAACTLVAGCSNYHKVESDYSFGPEPKEGLVVFSMVEENHAFGITLGRPPSTVSYRKTGERDVGQLLLSNMFKKDDFSDPPGSLYMFPLEPGEYEFTTWECHYGAYRSSARIKLPRFKINAGEIVYLGEIHLVIPPDGKVVRYKVTDKSKRDLTIFGERMVHFSASDVHNLLARPAAQTKESTSAELPAAEPSPANRDE